MSILCYIFCVAYIILVLWFFIKIMRNGGFFLYSPLFLIYISFITSDLLPALSYASANNLPDNVQYVIISTIVVYFFFLFLYRKQFTKSIIIKLPQQWKFAGFARKRVLLFFVLMAVLFSTGLITGITRGIFSGADVEGLRRTSEIGIGFLRDIPRLGIKIIALIFLIAYYKNKTIKAGIICLGLGVFCFLIYGHKSEILNFALIFTFYYCFCHRNLRWYEVIAYYSVIPIAAGILQTIRQGKDNFIENITIFQNYTNILFKFNTLAVMQHFEAGNFFYWGEEYYIALVKVIPRFLWTDKPLSFDYRLKELVGYDFEGGGVPVSTPFSLFINFGYYNWIGLIVWLFVIHSFYGILIDVNKSFYAKMIVLFSLSTVIVAFIGNLEIMLLFLVLCLFIYGRKKMI